MCARQAPNRRFSPNPLSASLTFVPARLSSARCLRLALLSINWQSTSAYCLLKVLFDQVRSFETFGCLVELSDQLTALVPPLHLADIELKKPASKFKPGSTLKCRVHTAFECSAPIFGALTFRVTRLAGASCQRRRQGGFSHKQTNFSPVGARCHYSIRRGKGRPNSPRVCQQSHLRARHRRGVH